MEPPPSKKPKRVAFLETEGWAEAEEGAREAMSKARSRLTNSGIEVVDKSSHGVMLTLENAIKGGVDLTGGINSWEFRWPLNTYARDMDSGKLSREARDRLAFAEAMTHDDYKELINKRSRIREIYAKLKLDVDVFVTLSAPGPAPIGLKWTGNAVFAVPSSILGTPSFSLPVLEVEGLPLGLQVMGFMDEDALTFSAARAILDIF